MRKSRVIAFRALALLVPLAFLELAARLLFPQPVTMYVPSHDSRLIYELRPSQGEINSLGMRQAEIDPAALRDGFVIAVIGDSHAYSVRSAKREDSFPARLEQHLRERTGKNVAVLNFGVPGYDMAQELEVLKAKVLELKPDLVILQYCINDEHISNYIQPKYPALNRAIHSSALVTALWTHLLYSKFGRKHLVTRVERYFPDLLLYTPGLVGAPWAREEESDPAHRGHPSRSKELVPERYHDFIGRESLERDVREFGRACRSAGVPALATGFIEPRDTALYTSAGFRVYSFLEMFEGSDTREYGYDPAHTDGHFTERGSDRIGSALAEYVGAHFALTKN